MIFAYGDISEQSIINALANEEYPMGNIGGTFKEKIKGENIALYDTAQVYVSQASMIECCGNLKNIFQLFPSNRIRYQVIEIFFVELILFQDAAIDKVYTDLIHEQEGQYKLNYSDYNIEKFEQISFDMSRAIKFGDYKQFNFPTTRESARRVAENFGIEYIFEKYERNKELLHSMLSANKRRIENKENKLQSRFLLIISALATVQALGDIIYAIATDNKGAGIAYAAAVLIAIIGYILYSIIMFLYKKFLKND